MSKYTEALNGLCARASRAMPLHPDDDVISYEMKLREAPRIAGAGDSCRWCCADVGATHTSECRATGEVLPYPAGEIAAPQPGRVIVAWVTPDELDEPCPVEWIDCYLKDPDDGSVRVEIHIPEPTP